MGGGRGGGAWEGGEGGKGVGKRGLRTARRGARKALEEAQASLAAAEEEWEERVVVPLSLALEVLTALVGEGGGEDEEEEEGEEEEEEWDSDQDEDRMEAMAVEMSAMGREGGREGGGVSAARQLLFSLLLGTEVLPRAFQVAQSLSGCLLQALSSLPSSSSSAVEGGREEEERRRSSTIIPIPLIRQVLELRSRAVLALGSLLSEMPSLMLETEGGRVWEGLLKMGEEGMEEEGRGHGPWYCRGEEPWLGLLTGVMGSFVRRRGVGGREGGREGEVELLARMVRTCPYFEVRVNAAGMLGCVCPSSSPSSLVSSVGKILKEALLTETHVLVEAAVLNAIMDWFSDDDKERDRVFIEELGFLSVLKEVLPAFRLKCKVEAGKHGKDAVGHVKETALNVARFIKYKQKAV